MCLLVIFKKRLPTLGCFKECMEQTMKLEDQVCSLDLAKRLKELGVKQESLFHWGCDGSGFSYLEPSNESVWPKKWLYSAFTVAELGEMLNSFEIRSGRYNDQNCTCFSEDRSFHEPTEANARAKCLIYLLEKKFIKL